MSGSLGMLLGAGATRSAQLIADSYGDVAVQPADASITMTLGNDGSFSPITSQSVWLTGAGPTSAYEVRATITGGSPGSFSTGEDGVWENLGTSQSWSRDRTGGEGISSVTALFEIRDAFSLVVLASAEIELTAEVILDA